MSRPLAPDELARLRGLGQGQVPGVVQQILDARAAQHSADLKAAAEWLASTGYPLEWHASGAGQVPPRPLWDALIDYIHTDPDGSFHGNELDRVDVESWLLDELGLGYYPGEVTA